MAPVGREFGSPDCVPRLEQLDRCAFDVFGDMALAHEWLCNPHPALDGMTSNDCARSDAGLHKVLDLLAGFKLGASTGAGNQDN